MWIEIDFDERVFPEYVWNDFFRSARPLRHVAGDALERVRVTAHAANVDGRPSKTVRVAVSVRAGENSEMLTFEFASGGHWRVRPTDPEAHAPFMLFRPDTRHEYERDVLHRSEFQVAILQDGVREWLKTLGREDASP